MIEYSYKTIHSLRHAKHRKVYNKFLIEGKRIVESALGCDANIDMNEAASSSFGCLIVHRLPYGHISARYAKHTLRLSTGIHFFLSCRYIQALPRLHALPYLHNGINFLT